ncbi:MAG: hypothetical protein FJ123_00180 [Deltaproteobacteria bacterium]|nr:hypothetical protein [Deltaproteobacteria bacterium]
MQRLKTLTGHEFQFKTHPDKELIVYPPDDQGNLQEKSAIVITPFTQNLVKEGIKLNGQILMGASRDNPPKNSLGFLIREEKQSPQQLSYLLPILIDEGFCTFAKAGKAFVIKYKRS